MISASAFAQGTSGAGIMLNAGYSRPQKTHPELANVSERLNAGSLAFENMTRFSQMTFNMALNDQALRVGAARVDSTFFATLGASPERGRLIDQRDQTP